MNQIHDLEDPWNVLAVLDEYYQHLNNEETGYVHPGSTNLTPSTAVGRWGKCPKFLGYKLVGEPPYVNIDAEMRRRWDMGHDREDRVKEMLDWKFGDRVQHQVNAFIPEIHLRGRIDAVLDGKYGYDLKTVTKRIIEQRMASRTAEQRDIDQMLFYIHPLGLESCTLLYECTDSMYPPVVFVIGPDQKRFDYYYTYLKTRVVDIVEQGDIPMPVPGSYCRSCPYREPCDRGVFGE